MPQETMPQETMPQETALRAPRRHGEGLLFDTAYLEPEIHLWIRTADGGLLHLSTPFHPRCYLTGPREVAGRAARRLADEAIAVPLGWTRRIEFWSGRPIPALALRVARPGALVERVRRLLRAERRLAAYDVDLDPALVFHSRHGLFPLARVAFSWDPDGSGGGSGDNSGGNSTGGRLVFIRALDTPWDPGFVLPPLRVLTLRLTRSPLIPLEGSGPLNSVRAESAGEACEIDPAGPAPGLAALAALIERHDPDWIDSERGDQTIFPWLLEAVQRTGIELPLDRAAPSVRRKITRRTQAIVVYGQVMFKASAYPLLGRWHLDRANSFFIDKAGIEGLVELARMSRLPIQRQARASGGTAMTAMEIHLALEKGMLVPFIKDQVEAFRPASELLRADKGGLTYFPPAGIWEGVIELDFAQQYPTIMAVHNVSPETMDCACCVGKNPVPGVAHHTCSRRRGLVPEALSGLLSKRLKYKQLLKTCPPGERSRYDARQSAIKWTLVTTFGYQGFKSAKFGHIAAHEAITAWGRETLLIAKEVFEDAGYRMLHALTDSLYVLKPGFDPDEVARLADEVRSRTGLTLGVEGVYDWICFLPSKVRRELSVATRYFGRFADGTLKLRGLKVRQHGTPPFIRAFQEALLAIMGACRSRAELEAAAPRLRSAYEEAREALWRGRVAPAELAIAARVSREVERYKANSPVPVCLRILAARGIRIPPGQKVRYLIVNRAHPDPLERYLPEPFLDEARGYDAVAYQAMLLDAFKEVTVNLERSRHVWDGPQQQRLL
ncbi:MAG: hypothetical protein IIC64_10775 [SAR324 cluster bacterium]|nr:hypothetical protein [SAR324 cluster bacterium]